MGQEKRDYEYFNINANSYEYSKQMMQNFNQLFEMFP